MSKNIVILFDGTSNEISTDRTNILRLFGTLHRSDEQIVYYDPGVGTFGADDSWSPIWHDAVEVWGLATGWGLDQNVKEAYRFLVENYDAGPMIAGHHPDRDRIYLFGFSRGAYTARVLAGFIHAFGLTTKYSLNLLNYAYRTYKSIPSNSSATAADGKASFKEMRLYEKTLSNDRPPIKLLGLFDTVASLIELGHGRLQMKTHTFTHRNPSIEWVRHALAIDERRTMFRPEAWTPDQDYQGDGSQKEKQNFKEVWFAGVHGDVGGGYPEMESSQIKIPLEWMIRETEATGLIFDHQVIDKIVLGKDPKTIKYTGLSSTAPLHNSMNAGWQLLEWLPRKIPPTSARRNGASGIYIPRSDPRLIPAGALLHESVRTRLSVGDYHPPNLPARHQFVA